MLIKRSEFLDALESVQPGLASKEIIEQSNAFIFADGEVITYNDEVTVTCPIDLDIEGAVQAHELIKLLQRMKDDEIEIEVTEEELKIKGKKTKAGIRLQADVLLPIDEVEIPEKWKKIPKGFIDALDFCHFNVSTDMSRMILTNIHVHGDKVQSCDNFRVTEVILGSDAKKVFKEPLLIPGSVIKYLKSYSPIEYNIIDGWIHFLNEDDVVFSTRTSEEEDYPDLSAFLEVEGDPVTMPDGIAEVLERAEIFIDNTFEQDKKIDIKITENKMVVKGTGPAGWFEETLSIEHTGDEITFSIHPRFLLQSLQLLDEMTIGEDKLKLSGKGFTHTACLAQE